MNRAAVTRAYRPLCRGLWLDRRMDTNPGVLGAAYSRLYPGSVVTGWSAAHIHAFTVPGDAYPQLWVGAEYRRRRGVILRRYQLPPEHVHHIRGVRVVTQEWMAYDLARFSEFEDAVVALESLGRRGLDLHRLARLLDERAGRWGTRRARDALAAVDLKSESEMETLTRLTLLRAGITGFQTHVRVPLLRYRLDLADPINMVAIEYDGAHHRDPAQHAADVQRRNRLEAAGWIVIVVTYKILRYHPQEFVDQVWTALHRARARGRRPAS